jgi:Fructose-1-6-bisphosphatase, C-terminal domain
LDRATTVLVLTLGSGVDGFTLDPDTSRFLHTHQDLRIPAAGPIYSFNEANFHDFDDPVQRYLNALKEGSSSVGVRSNARYVGSLVADVHNILINGGIYGYPATLSNNVTHYGTSRWSRIDRPGSDLGRETHQCPRTVRSGSSALGNGCNSRLFGLPGQSYLMEELIIIFFLSRWQGPHLSG